MTTGDARTRSKNTIFVQLGGDSFCFLPLNAKLLSKRLNHNKMLQHDVTIFSEGLENLYCRFIHTTRTILMVTSNLGSCFAGFVLGIVSCFHAQSIVLVTYTGVSLHLSLLVT